MGAKEVARRLGADRRSRRMGAAESFTEACRWLPLFVGVPFALMFLMGLLFGWL